MKQIDLAQYSWAAALPPPSAWQREAGRYACIPDIFVPSVPDYEFCQWMNKVAASRELSMKYFGVNEQDQRRRGGPAAHELAWMLRPAFFEGEYVFFACVVCFF